MAGASFLCPEVDEDLANHRILVQLPDVRAVKFNITYQDRSRVAPGYWFVSPYLHISPDQPTSLYEQYQVGPHIYDQDGVCRSPIDHAVYRVTLVPRLD